MSYMFNVRKPDIIFEIQKSKQLTVWVIAVSVTLLGIRGICDRCPHIYPYVLVGKITSYTLPLEGLQLNTVKIEF